VTETSVAKPHLANGVRLHWDRVRERHVLLYPEGALVLNGTATAVLELCNGERTVDDIAGELGTRFAADVHADVQNLLQAMRERGLVSDD
jgi:pyrroloquinoline quinone biosynthesis protein D